MASQTTASQQLQAFVSVSAIILSLVNKLSMGSLLEPSGRLRLVSRLRVRHYYHFLNLSMHGITITRGLPALLQYCKHVKQNPPLFVGTSSLSRDDDSRDWRIDKQGGRKEVDFRSSTEDVFSFCTSLKNNTINKYCDISLHKHINLNLIHTRKRKL